MRTALVTSTYMVGLDNNGKGTRLERTQKWLDYYCNQNFLAFDGVHIFDNGSNAIQKNNISLPNNVFTVVYDWPHLPRRSNEDFLHQYRAFFEIKKLFAEYDKVIWLDDDCFILSWPLAEWVNNMETGWRTLWCPKHSFPMYSIDVICSDQFKNYEKFFFGDDFSRMNNTKVSIETIVPFTHVCKDFVADRYGEYDPIPQQAPEMDLYSQCPVDVPMRFNYRNNGYIKFNDNSIKPI